MDNLSPSALAQLYADRAWYKQVLKRRAQKSLENTAIAKSTLPAEYAGYRNKRHILETPFGEVEAARSLTNGGLNIGDPAELAGKSLDAMPSRRRRRSSPPPVETEEELLINWFFFEDQEGLLLRESWRSARGSILQVFAAVVPSAVDEPEAQFLGLAVSATQSATPISDSLACGGAIIATFTTDKPTTLKFSGRLQFEEAEEGRKFFLAYAPIADIKHPATVNAPIEGSGEYFINKTNEELFFELEPDEYLIPPGTWAVSAQHTNSGKKVFAKYSLTFRQ